VHPSVQAIVIVALLSPTPSSTPIVLPITSSFEVCDIIFVIYAQYIFCDLPRSVSQSQSDDRSSLRGIPICHIFSHKLT